MKQVRQNKNALSPETVAGNAVVHAVHGFGEIWRCRFWPKDGTGLLRQLLEWIRWLAQELQLRKLGWPLFLAGDPENSGT